MINLWTDRGRLLASYRVNGKLEIRDLGPAEYTAFVKDPNALAGDYSVIDRRPDFPGWTKLVFYDYDSRKLALEANPGLLYEADVSPVRRFISDHNVKIDPPKRAYLDIETDSDVPFSLAVEGQARLMSFALVDEAGNVTAELLEADTDDSEVELWRKLWLAVGEFDQIGSWNGDRFDFEVIEKRSFMFARRYGDVMKPYWEHKRRILFVDQLLNFKRHHMAPDSGDEKTSLKLDDVGNALVGEGKTEITGEIRAIIGKSSLAGATRKLWEGGTIGRAALLKYNIQDAQLQRKIEEATEYLALQQTIAEVTHTFVNTHGIKPVGFVDAYMLKSAHRRKTHLPSKLGGEDTGEQYEGAFVMDTKIKGIMRMVHVCDFKSLYPTVIRTWNLGAESKGLPGSISANGISFGNKEETILAECCREFMNLRDHWKKEMKKFPPGTPEWKAAERKSKAYKIANNSVYGVGGCPYSRIYDVQIVEAITLGAQMLNRTVAKAAQDRGWDPLAGDTDSNFICGCSVKEFSDFVEWCNENLFPKILDEHKCNPEFRCIELAYEKCFDRLVAPQGNDGSPASKRYFGSYLHHGGVPGLAICPPGQKFDKTKHSKPEVKGLEFMRGDSLKIARRMQYEAIMMILAGEENPEKMEAWVLAQRQKFFNSKIPVEDIVKSVGISRELSAYKTNGPHVRLARELEAKGEDVGEGTRISYITVDGSKSPTVVIPADEFDGTNFDKFHYWNSAVYPPTLRVLAGAFPNRDWKRWISRRPKPVLAGQLALL